MVPSQIEILITVSYNLEYKTNKFSKHKFKPSVYMHLFLTNIN